MFRNDIFSLPPFFSLFIVQRCFLFGLFRFFFFSKICNDSCMTKKNNNNNNNNNNKNWKRLHPCIHPNHNIFSFRYFHLNYGSSMCVCVIFSSFKKIIKWCFFFCFKIIMKLISIWFFSLFYKCTQFIRIYFIILHRQASVYTLPSFWGVALYFFRSSSLFFFCCLLIFSQSTYIDEKCEREV